MNKYWKAVNKRVNWLVSKRGWSRNDALANTRQLFKNSRYWRAWYEGKIK